MYSTIGYHTRLYSDNTKKMCGGSFGGPVAWGSDSPPDQQTCLTPTNLEPKVKTYYYSYPDTTHILETKDLNRTEGTYYTKAEGQRLIREAAITHLRSVLKPGDTVAVIIRSVASSGMSRKMSFYTQGLQHITHQVGAAIQTPCKDGMLTVSGCGMDMAFATVYSLGRVLFPDGFGVEGTYSSGRYSKDPTLRPPTQEKAALAVAKGFKFRGRNGDTGGWDADGGYALRHVVL
jgi:hypothetical protein